MIRCYLSPEQWGEGEVLLSGAEAHHLARVFRVAPGDPLICSDGAGREASAEVLRVSSREIAPHVGPSRPIFEPPYRMTLGIAVPGQGKLDEIVNQATQTGVRRLIPLITERTVVRKPADLEKKADRLRRIAVEAVKQSGAGRVPEIVPALAWGDLIPLFQEYDRVLLASVEGPWEELSEILAGNCRKPLLLIGPEGDFTPSEIEQAVRNGARRFSLGPNVLRCETACVAAVSLVSYLLRTR